jgi:hypothetical protein
MARHLNAGNGRPRRIEVVTAASGVNEDIAGVRPPYYWVIDASTPLFEAHVTQEPSDALWLAKRIDDYLHARIARERAEIRLRPLVEGLAAAIAKDLRRVGAPRGPEGLSAALGIIRTNAEGIDYLILGDVTLIVSTGRRIQAVRDEGVTRFDRAALDVFEAELAAGAPYPLARKRTTDRLREHRKHMNAESGYWILSNSLKAVGHAEQGKVRAGTGSKVLLMSDGFSRSVDVFHLYRGWRGLLAAAQREPLAAAIAKLRHAESADRQARRYPRLSRHDDATALYLELT